ncbi:MAG TPA: hypothetical protein VK750_00640 [Cytophagaceae bacterium]|jgi:hypothetical protein|nr:hypothetical protein [Cytophagaceae bacterium]
MLKLAGKVCLFLLLGVSVVRAQSVAVDSAKIQKEYRPWVTYTSARVEKIFTKGSSLFAEYGTLLQFRGITRISQDTAGYYSLNENYNSFLWAGYEHAFTEHWYGGISGKANFVQIGSGSFFTRFNVAHRGHISKLFFYKEFAFEYLSYTIYKGYKRPDEGRISASIGLGRKWQFGKKSLYVGVNYRLFVNFDLKDNKNGFYNNRKIDRTKLKAEITYGFNPHLHLTAYYLRDTEYYYSLGGTTASGSPIADSKINRITEGIGFTLTYLLFKDNPDKYVTELPAR